MLFAYFDESGTDLQSPHVVIAGFIGRVEDWGDVGAEWKAETDKVGVAPFHRVECQALRGRYRDWDRAKATKHTVRLAKIIAGSQLMPISASFNGDWGSLGLTGALAGRYPHPYHMCFELLMENIIALARTYGPDEQVAVIMERQDQFSYRAHRIYDIFRHNRRWPSVVHFSYSDKGTCQALEYADFFCVGDQAIFLAGKGFKYKAKRLPPNSTPPKPQRLLRGRFGKLSRCRGGQILPAPTTRNARYTP